MEILIDVFMLAWGGAAIMVLLDIAREYAKAIRRMLD